MIRSTAALLLFTFSIAGAQTMQYSPLGGVVKPGVHPKLAAVLRSQLPEKAVVLMDAKTHMSPAGEESVVYSNHVEPIGDGITIYEENWITVFEHDHLAASFPLTSFADPKDRDNKEIMSDYAFFSYQEIPDPTRPVVGFSFHNDGDGSGTFLMLLAYMNGHYKVVFYSDGQQSQLRYNVATHFYDYWDGNGGSCVWCDETYKITRLAWSNGKLVRGRSFDTRHNYSPYPMSDRPILLTGEPR